MPAPSQRAKRQAVDTPGKALQHVGEVAADQATDKSDKNKFTLGIKRVNDIDDDDGGIWR